MVYFFHAICYWIYVFENNLCQMQKKHVIANRCIIFQTFGHENIVVTKQTSGWLCYERPSDGGTIRLLSTNGVHFDR